MSANSSLLSMDGNNSTPTVQAIQSLLRLIRLVTSTSAIGFNGRFKKDCTDLSRRVALLSHLCDEIRDLQVDRRRLHTAYSSPSFLCSISKLTAALKATKKLLFYHIFSREISAVEFKRRFQSVSCKLEKALAIFPYDDLDISKDVKEQVDFVRGQLIRAAQRCEDDLGVESKVRDITNALGDVVIPVDFLCPISLELFRDPVIVSTGHTYERSYIQRWINSGKRTCPKTRQKLQNRNLTPNYVLRSLITQWCTDHNVQPATLQGDKKTKKYLSCFS